MNHKILIVDDDELNLEILDEILSDDYPLIKADNGRDAVQKTREHNPAIVLMDIMMPEMNGYEACKLIKDAEYERRAPNVILVSAKASAEERVRGYEAGADDYIIKPFDSDELLAKVKVHIRLCDALFDLDAAHDMLSNENRSLEGVIQQQTQQLTDTRDLLVFAMAKLADSRDPETGEHLERIREYCQVLAEHLSTSGEYADQIDENFIENIYLSSPLHDIGKVGIPDAILLKPGRLTDDEFNIMKQHTVIGFQALQSVACKGSSGEFLNMSIDIARHHHEKFNGAGYPDALSGQDIPLSARICGVADVFDALTSVRVYKSAFSIEVAKSMILSDSGTHFDPIIVDAFNECFDKFAEIRVKHVEKVEVSV